MVCRILCIKAKITLISIMNALTLLLFSIFTLSASYTFRPSVTPSSLSSLTSISGSPSVSRSSANTVSGNGFLSKLHNMEMKKGKPNVPPMMRSQYKQQQNMNSMREQVSRAAERQQWGGGAKHGAGEHSDP